MQSVYHGIGGMAINTNILTTDSSPWWAKLLDRFGISTCMLAVLVYAIYIVTMWSATNVITPIVLSHMELLKATRDATSLQTTILLKIDKSLDERNDIMMRLGETHGLILKAVNANQILIRDKFGEIND